MANIKTADTQFYRTLAALGCQLKTEAVFRDGCIHGVRSSCKKFVVKIVTLEGKEVKLLYPDGLTSDLVDEMFNIQDFDPSYVSDRIASFVTTLHMRCAKHEGSKLVVGNTQHTLKKFAVTEFLDSLDYKEIYSSLIPVALERPIEDCL